MSRRALGAVATGVAALAVVSLAACGTSAPASRATSPHAAERGVASSEAPPSGGSTSTALSSKLENAFRQGRSAHVLMDLGAAGTGTGAIDFAGSSPSMDIRISGSQTGAAEMRLVGGALYVKSSMAGNGWVRLDASSAAAAGLDPTSFLDQFKGLRGGTDLGGGHWRIGQSGTSADIYFDARGLVEKTVAQEAGSAPIIITYSDWGTRVVVQAPPADQVTDVSTVPSGAPPIAGSPAS